MSSMNSWASSDPPAPASQKTLIPGLCHHAQQLYTLGFGIN